MKTKLTLYLEKDVIEGLKEHARKLGISLSQFIENEFRSMQPRVEEPVPEYFRKMQFENAPDQSDWENERADYLSKKHG